MDIERIQILTDAVSDPNEAREFYEKQGHNVGNYFWDSILLDIETLMIFAGVQRKKYGYYRMLAKRFPYAVYYTVTDNIASIVAILPMRRDLLWVKTKINERG